MPELDCPQLSRFRFEFFLVSTTALP